MLKNKINPKTENNKEIINRIRLGNGISKNIFTENVSKKLNTKSIREAPITVLVAHTFNLLFLFPALLNTHAIITIIDMYITD